MKKSLIALAALAATGAFAQSSVSLTGGINAGFGRTTNYTTGVTQTGISNNQVAANNLTFTAVEDLGSGLKATALINVRFSPATGENISNGGQTAAGTNSATLDAFAQNARFSVSGGFGEIRAGRYTGLLGDALTGFDAFGTDVGVVAIDSSNLVPTRYNSMASYISPSFAGLRAGIQYADKNANGGAANENGLEMAVTYVNGPISAVVGTTKITASATAPNAGRDGTDTTTLAGSYDFGFVKPMIAYAKNNGNAGKADDLKEIAYGLTAPVGAFTVKAAFKTTTLGGKDTKGNALGVTYALSKRTSLIADTYDNDAKVGTPAAATARSYYLGVRHTF